MPVMKAKHTHKLRESAIVMDLSDLELEAGRILAQARAQSQKILADAKAAAERDALRIREEARLAGHAEGTQAGLTEGRTQGHDEAVAQTQQTLRDLAARWSNTLELLQQHMPVHVADARTDLLRLALAIAERVTRQESLRNRNVAPALAEETLRMVGSARRVALHVNPIEMDLLENYLPDVLARIRSIESVELIPDDTVGEGGCLLRFGTGEIDARIDSQLARIADELLGTPDAPAAGAP